MPQSLPSCLGTTWKWKCGVSCPLYTPLEGEDAQRAVCLHQRLRDPPGRGQHGRAFLVGKIEQRRHVPAGDDAALPDLELARVDEGQRELAFLDDLPSFLARRQTEVAGISYGKLDHWPPR